MRNLYHDETGLVVSAELVLIISLAFTAAAVGLGAARDALTQEFNDISDMIGTLDQSYNISALSAVDGSGNKGHGTSNAMGFNDRLDLCDCQVLVEVEIAGKTQAGTATESGGAITP